MNMQITSTLDVLKFIIFVYHQLSFFFAKLTAVHGNAPQQRSKRPQNRAAGARYHVPNKDRARNKMKAFL